MGEERRQRVTKVQKAERDKIVRDMVMANCTVKEMQDAVREQLGLSLYGRDISSMRAKLQLKRPYRRRFRMPDAEPEAPQTSPSEAEQTRAEEPTDNANGFSLRDKIQPIVDYLRGSNSSQITVFLDGRFEVLTRGSVHEDA